MIFDRAKIFREWSCRQRDIVKKIDNEESSAKEK